MNNTFDKIGRSNILRVINKETMIQINNSIRDVLVEIENLVKIKKDENKKKINDLIISIFLDKKIRELGSREYHEEVYIPKFKKILNIENLIPYPLLPFSVRINIPGYNEFSSGWHQDRASFLYGSGKNFWYKSFAMWIAITEADQNNGVEFFDKDHYEEKIYNSHFRVSERHKKIQYYRSDLPKKPINVFKSSFDYGEGIVFDSLIFHRTAPEPKKTRISFDLRVFCPEKKYKVMKAEVKLRIKRFLFEKFDIRLLS